MQIQFLNDAWAGTPSTDRNLYVNSIAFDGKTEAGTSAPLWSAGTADFAVAGGTAAVAAPPDVLTVHLSEDAFQGNAAFRLTIDGKPITTPQQVVALHGSAKWQDFTVAGSFGAGTHSIGVAFTNNLDGGTSGTGRNLYVNGIDVNGQHYGSGVSTLLTNSTASFSVVTAH